jgi:hypothetical protein
VLTPQPGQPAALAAPRGTITITPGRKPMPSIDPNLNDPIPY